MSIRLASFATVRGSGFERQSRLEIPVPAVKIVIAALLIGFFLLVQHSALAQSAKEASQLNSRAIELSDGARYSEAEPLFKRALAIREKALGPNHPDVAAIAEQSGSSCTSSRSLCRCRAVVQAVVGDQRKSTRSRSSRCCDIAEQSGCAVPRSRSLCRCRAVVQAVIGNPGKSPRSRSSRCRAIAEQSGCALYQAQGRYADAEPLYKRSLAIREKALGPDHPDVATFAEQSWLSFIRAKVAMPMPSRCTSGRWRYGKKRLVPIIPMLRHR